MGVDGYVKKRGRVGMSGKGGGGGGARAFRTLTIEMDSEKKFGDEAEDSSPPESPAKRRHSR